MVKWNEVTPELARKWAEKLRQITKDLNEGGVHFKFLHNKKEEAF